MTPTHLDDAQKAFSKSFNQLNEVEQPALGPAEIEDKMLSTFKTFCKLVEKGVREALALRSNIGNLQPSPAVQEAPKKTLGGGLRKPGSGREMAPSLYNHRSMRRTSSGRVRSVGRTASCYLSREGSHKLKVTIEARLRADAEGKLSSIAGQSTANLAMGSTNTLDAASNSTVSLNSSVSGSTQSLIPQLTLSDQAMEVKDAIAAMVKGLPPLIPGTPIIVIFNAIVEHEQPVDLDAPGDVGDLRRAFSWSTTVSTPDGKQRQAERQAELEAAFKAQGVSLDTTKPKPKQEGTSGGGIFSFFGSKSKSTGNVNPN
ncbi:hypothetical protein HDV05_004807 [Chytridiales sp. JEL 0842]|nr:hypothetical protein HDV05_004807 [Chytridiales sp. JEL 0842]